MIKQVIEILDEISPGTDWENQDDLLENHILDSLKIVQLVGALNDEFDISITPVDLVPENFKNAAAVSALVERLSDE